MPCVGDTLHGFEMKDVTCIDAHGIWQAQRQLQKSLEAHGKYITSLIEKDRAAQGEPGISHTFQQPETYLQTFSGAVAYKDISLDPSTAGQQASALSGKVISRPCRASTTISMQRFQDSVVDHHCIQAE